MKPLPEEVVAAPLHQSLKTGQRNGKCVVMCCNYAALAVQYIRWLNGCSSFLKPVNPCLPAQTTVHVSSISLWCHECFHWGSNMHVIAPQHAHASTNTHAQSLKSNRVEDVVSASCLMKTDLSSPFRCHRLFVQSLLCLLLSRWNVWQW